MKPARARSHITITWFQGKSNTVFQVSQGVQRDKQVKRAALPPGHSYQ
jgi:hypothetical protein